MTWEFASPLTLLGEWRDRADEADLHDLVLLGFTVDLPFLEKTLIPTARALGARVTVLGDAAQGLYDPVDVRSAGRSYFHGLAACRGAFHPKLALLIGADEAVAAIGSGNPTMAGWGYNDELWTVLCGRDDGAPVALQELGLWLTALDGAVAMPAYAAELLRETGERLLDFRDVPHPARVLHNLEVGLLEQLPAGPVDELHLYAPFVDLGGGTLAAIIDRFAPSRIVMGLQERWSSYDGDVLLGAFGGRDVELRSLAERRPRHGKLLEWFTGGRWHALTGSANLTASAMIKPVADGNCELGVLAPVPGPLLPEGAATPLADLRGRKTARPHEGGPALLVLGALLTGAGLLQVTLARPYAAEVAVEVSPDGSPGSWETVGTVPAGETVCEFPVPEFAGAVVRIAGARTGGRSESPPVFVVHPARCARRRDGDDRVRLRRDYTEEEIVEDDELGRRFQHDLLRLGDLLAEHRAVQPARTARPATLSAVHDQYAAFLDECERTYGRPLTLGVFGRAGLPDLTTGARWDVAADVSIEDEDPDGPKPPDGGEPAKPGPQEMTSKAKREWRRWTARAVGRFVPEKGAAAPIMMRVLLARQFVRLLARGVWETGDESWREPMARITRALVPEPADDLPDEAVEHVTALTAVCMGLLRGGVSLTGGGPHDLLAADTWDVVRVRIVGARPERAATLFIPPAVPHARVLSRWEFERLADLAVDPLAAALDELAAEKLHVEHDAGLYRVTGSFGNPIRAAGRVATRLGRHVDTVLVHAIGDRGAAFVAWHRPYLVLASSHTWRGWRLYRLSGLVTPETRLSGDGGPPTIGLVGKPVRLEAVPPEAAQDVLARAGLDHLEVVRRLTGAGE
ncbi:hypothetical protein [Actinomadura rifamycini]|uniref:hypothetical protein n=1 Tax=Actinomadura rifamycini TaxID=31962 RepID=UPI0003FF8CBB|nr:hypothetical protein [Actinomadura rifamycini]